MTNETHEIKEGSVELMPDRVGDVHCWEEKKDLRWLDMIMTGMMSGDTMPSIDLIEAPSVAGNTSLFIPMNYLGGHNRLKAAWLLHLPINCVAKPGDRPYDPFMSIGQITVSDDLPIVLQERLKNRRSREDYYLWDEFDEGMTLADFISKWSKLELVSWELAVIDIEGYQNPWLTYPGYQLEQFERFAESLEDLQNVITERSKNPRI